MKLHFMSIGSRHITHELTKPFLLFHTFSPLLNRTQTSMDCFVEKYHKNHKKWWNSYICFSTDDFTCNTLSHFGRLRSLELCSRWNYIFLSNSESDELLAQLQTTLNSLQKKTVTQFINLSHYSIIIWDVTETESFISNQPLSSRTFIYFALLV